MTTIIIDSNSVCHRARHTLGNLSFEEKKVGIIFGFLKQILAVSKRFNSRRFVFCWDSRSKERIKLSSVYKQNRRKEKSEEEEELDRIAYDQFDAIRKIILPTIGFRNIFIEDGYESDDIIAKIVKDNNIGNAVIVSADSDLYQLLSEKVSLLISNDKPLFTKSDFVDKFGIEPSLWAEVKAIAGCPSDNVIGIKGVGEKSAVKYLKDELKHGSKTYKAIRNGEDLIEFNRKLVTLPFPGIRSFSLTNDDLSFDRFVSVCNKYGFNSFLSKESLSSWKKILL
jgi:DNA polymerase-1